MKVLAIIPARGGSKGIPGKNLAPLAGRPLIAYTIEAACTAKSVDRYVVSTEDSEITAASRALGAELIVRPPELSKDEIPTLPVLQHVVQTLAAGQDYHPDVVLTLQPTSPLRTARHIDEAVTMFQEDPQADSLVSCVELPHIFHPRSILRYRPDGYLEPYLPGPPPTRRQDKEPVYARNGAAIYITRTDCLSQFIYGGRLLGYIMDEPSSIDIDTPEDIKRAEALLAARSENA